MTTYATQKKMDEMKAEIERLRTENEELKDIHARQDVPALVAEVERLQDELAKARWGLRGNEE